MKTTNHKILITGGAKGIGLALARQFHGAGNELVLVGRDEAALRAAALSLPGTRICVADISDAGQRRHLIATFPDVNVLVNNAGIQRLGALEEMLSADIEHELDINLRAPILLTHAFLPNLRRHAEAAVINVTSVLALAPKQSAAIYCATKAGLHSFTRTLRWQLEGTPVRVFEIVPPLVDTAMTAGRGRNKISPEALAREFWGHFQKDRQDVFVGKAKAARLLARLLPSVAEKVLRHG